MLRTCRKNRNKHPKATCNKIDAMVRFYAKIGVSRGTLASTTGITEDVVT